jgi:uncharacterized protein YbbK (DUF523 family)
MIAAPYDALVSHDEEKSLRPVLVSACLLGRECRYDGAHNADALLARELEARGERAVLFCPEEHGGLETPRPPAWIEEGDAETVLAGGARVVTGEGQDVTANFLAGARGALEVCAESGAKRAYLKERSPSCGACSTYVAGALTEGPGVTTALLQSAGIEVEGVEGRRS